MTNKQTRQQYIRDRIDKHGSVSKKEIIEQFKVHPMTAASDLQLFGIMNDDVEYNRKTKRHEKK